MSSKPVWQRYRQKILARPDAGGVTTDHDGQSIQACLSPGEACLPSPNPGMVLHIIESYGDEPMQVTEFDPDDLEDERT